MKKLLFLLLLFTDVAFSQTLTLDKVNETAKQHYPLVRQKDLIQQTRNITVENLNKGYLPQLSLSGQATYQSDVTAVKIPVPGVSIDPLSRDQYRIVADVSQVIYDGGFIRQHTAEQAISVRELDPGLDPPSFVEPDHEASLVV